MNGDIARLEAGYRAGRRTPEDVVEEELERAAEAQAVLGPFRRILYARARAEARAATDRHRRGTARSPLDGVPVVVQAGMQESERRARRRPSGDGEEGLLARLRSHGAVVLAEADTAWRLAHRADVSPLRNPWAPEHAGGDGAPASVAAGVGAAALAVESCGWLRAWSARCGAVAFRPTRGALSCGGIHPLAPTLDQVAVVARHAADARLVYEALARARRPRARRRGGRLGVVPPVSLEGEAGAWAVRQAYEAALALLARDGVELVPVEPPPLPTARAAALTLWYAECLEVHRTRLAAHWADDGPAARRRLMAAAAVGGADYVRARAVRRALGDAWGPALRRAGVDALALPTAPPAAPEAAFALAGGALADTLLYTSFFDLIGAPAVTVPMGRDALGLPAGLQVAGAAGEDAAVLDWAERLEAVRGPWPLPPRRSASAVPVGSSGQGWAKVENVTVMASSVSFGPGGGPL
ncbi:MAG: hypothetical protein K6V73_09605 [Firmicutes bacterium]|nr:hypothetical protein [Bacillota bacterium]